MPYYKNDINKTRSLFLLLCVLFLLTTSSSFAKQRFNVTQASVVLEDKVYLVNAKIQYEFSEEVLDALKNGIPLIILLDIEVEQHRRWWFNKEIAKLEQGYLLLYHALSEKFIIHNLNSGTQENYSSLNRALYALGHLRNLPILDASLLSKGNEYIFKVRAHLDIEALPAPMRPLAYISSQWQLESDWYTWILKH